MKNITRAFILFNFIIFYSIGFSQNLKIQSKTEKIIVKDDTSFVTEIKIIFKESNVSRLYPILYDTELERVSDIQLFVKKRKRLKKLFTKIEREEDVELD